MVKKAAVKVVAPKVAVPSKRTPEVEAAILQDVAQGIALVNACKTQGIVTSTFFRWLDSSEQLRNDYAQAREAQADFHASEIVAISDEVEVSQVVTPDGVVDFKLDAVAVARNRLRIDARKWVAAKMLPKKYGDKVENVHTGADGGPIALSLTVSFVKPK
jgi:hypothetical protein